MREMSDAQKIERSITKTYRDTVWNPFIRALKQYELLHKGDKVAVCISGGKDSMLLAKLMQMLQRYSDFPFGLEFLVMDPGYNAENRKKIEENARILEIPITVFETNIFDVADKAEKYPCYLCAKMRRGHLYKKAQEMGCNKIALGHHFDDVIGTTLIGMFYGGQLQAMIPKLKSKNFPGMELIRPMYMVHEEDILTWKEANNLEFIQCACRFTENDAVQHDSKRQEIKQLIRSLREDNPNIECNIFASIHMLQLDMMVSWKYKGKEYSFLDRYDEE